MPRSYKKPPPPPLPNGMKRRVGRPELELDVKTAARVAGFGATVDEIAAALGCSGTLVSERIKDDPIFREAIEQGRAFGRVSLRRAQWQAAMGTPATEGAPAVPASTSMQIWLGKQVLGQRDYTSMDPVAASVSASSGGRKIKFTLKIGTHGPKDEGEDDGENGDSEE